MNTLFRCALLTAALLVVGCETTPTATPVPPSNAMNPETIQTLRASITAQNPDMLVEGVGRVLPSDDFLSLENARGEDFPVNTRVSVIDSNSNVLAHGHVVAIVNGEVQVQFTTSGPRRPQAGDAVVKIPK